MAENETENPNEHREGKAALIGLVMLQDVLPIIEEFTSLDGFKYKATIKPTHGSCCTCQDCGHSHDDCVCEHNEILHLIRLMPNITTPTDEMHTAAVKKAVEVGLLPKHAGHDGYIENWNKIKAVLTAALAA